MKPITLNRMVELMSRGGLFAVMAMLVGVGTVAAQESSLFHNPQVPSPYSAASPAQPQNPVANPSMAPQANSGVAMASPNAMSGQEGFAPLATASWTYQPAPPMRVFNRNDIITIRVDELGRLLAIGDAQKRRASTFSAALTDWIRLSEGRLRPDPQNNGDPTIGTESEDRFRNQATLEARESLTFNIAATIVDILPNGNLVLEARKSIRANDNVWETSLTGVCRAIDVGPDNVVLSKDLLNLEVHKEDQGQLRDGYKRGWFTRWLDRLQPF